MFIILYREFSPLTLFRMFLLGQFLLGRSCYLTFLQPLHFSSPFISPAPLFLQPLHFSRESKALEIERSWPLSIFSPFQSPAPFNLQPLSISSPFQSPAPFYLQPLLSPVLFYLQFLSFSSYYSSSATTLLWLFLI